MSQSVEDAYGYDKVIVISGLSASILVDIEAALRKSSDVHTRTEAQRLANVLSRAHHFKGDDLFVT